MRNTARPEDYLARTDMKLVIANLNNVPPFEHVPQFGFVLVNVSCGGQRVGIGDPAARFCYGCSQRFFSLSSL
jgi:hypothetical protein